MDQLQHLALRFTPSPRDGLAFSALPDAPIRPMVERRLFGRHVGGTRARVLGARHALRLVRVRPVAMPTTCSH